MNGCSLRYSLSGFGPRKAAYLIKALVKKGIFTTRKDLLGEYMKRKVFVNAAGFLHICRSGLVNNRHFVDLLDDSRIHPESYELAKHMAMDVYNADVRQEACEDDIAFEMAVDHVREKPAYLKALDIDKYATSVEERYNVINRRDTLQTIKMEFLEGFRDWRTPYRESDQNEVFYIISGESEDTLAEGRVVQVTVCTVHRERAFCVLESGLSGLLMIEDYSDEKRPTDFTNVLNKGDILACKIKSIQKSRYQVYLTFKESKPKGDYYNQLDDRGLQSEQEKALKQKEFAKRHLKRSMIIHPCFQDVTADEAVKVKVSYALVPEDRSF